MIDFANTEYLQEIAEKRFGGEMIYKKSDNKPDTGPNWMDRPAWPGITGNVVNCAGVLQESYVYVGFLPRYFTIKEHVRSDYQHFWVRKEIYEKGRDYTPESQLFSLRMERAT